MTAVMAVGVPMGSEALALSAIQTETGARWTVAIAGAVVMLTTGTVYSWAIFTQPLLVAFHWDVTVTTTAFSIANFALAAVGALIGGFWQDQVGPRRVALTGVTFWGMGNLLAGLGTASMGAPWLYLTYGVLGGIGVGMAYVTPLAMVTKWFPDRKGLVGGLVAGAFGLGAFCYNQLVPRLESFHAAALHASTDLAAKTAAQTFTAADIDTVMRVFVVSGLVFLVVGLGAASLFRNPPSSDSKVAAPGYSPSQVLRTPQFYLLWLQLFVSVIGGLTIISNSVFILADLTRRPAAELAPLFGLVSICNALGRCFWGAISDRIGCNHTFAALFAVQAITLFCLSEAHSLSASLACVAVVLLCCGGGFGTMPSFNAGYFGTRFMGRNYGLILSAWGFAGVTGPLWVAHVKDVSGSFAAVLPYLAGILAVAVVLPFMTRKPPASAGPSDVV